MKISNEGILFIKGYEKCELKAYKATPKEPYYTIGWGHYGRDVTKGMTITQAKADSLFLSDIKKYEKAVDKYQSKYNFNQNQYNALCSFCYNLGTASIDQLTNNGKRTIAQISAKIPAYCTSNGVRLAGLVRRRADEKKMFDTPVKSTSFVYGGIDYSLVFDPSFYAAKNADIKEAFGTDANELFNHFLVFGINEISRAGKTIATFNVEVYKSHSADLQKAFGDDIKAYYNHYCSIGYKENRRVI